MSGAQHGSQGRGERAPHSSSGVLAWLLPPLLLGAVAIGVFIVLRRPVAAFGWVMGALFGGCMLWIAVSVFWPARADRTCPHCARETLERLDPRTTRGLCCRACGWSEESTSSFLLAEEEGPLERIVLAERRARFGGSARAAAPLGSPHTGPRTAPPGTRD